MLCIAVVQAGNDDDDDDDNCPGEVQRLLVRHDTDVLRSSWREFAIAVSPIEIEQWKTSSCLSRLYAVFKVRRLSASVSADVNVVKCYINLLCLCKSSQCELMAVPYLFIGVVC